MNIKQEEIKLAIVFPPGDILEEKLEELNMTVQEFARLCGKTEAEIQAFIDGGRVTPTLAKTFENVLHIPAYIWKKHQALYDHYLARLAKEKQRELTMAD